MPITFNVTYEIVTQESAEHGDAEERGFVSENNTLRDAVADLFDIRQAITCIEADEAPVTSPRWITVYGGMNDRDGSFESRSLHIPDNVTTSSRMRIWRLTNS